MKLGTFAKEYFKKNGTVSTWWEPESAHAKYDQYLYRRETEDIVKIIRSREAKHVLEVGTGKGRIAIELAKIGCKVTAVDVSKEMLRIAAQRAREKSVAERIIFEEGDAENLTYADNFFDAAICIAALIHIPNQQKCVRELARVTRTNGIVIVNQANKDNRWILMVRGVKAYIQAIATDVYFSAMKISILNFLIKALTKIR
nr:class I SAM-dependent methyltransferase [Candidatus Freyarchaeota archaeon]